MSCCVIPSLVCVTGNCAPREHPAPSGALRRGHNECLWPRWGNIKGALAPPGAPAADGRCRAVLENPAFFTMRTLRFSHLKPCVFRIGRRLAHGGTAEYQRRIVDDELDEVFPEIAAISLDGPKAVGKTTTAGQRVGALNRLVAKPKHHLADPALSARLLGLDSRALLTGAGRVMNPGGGSRPRLLIRSAGDAERPRLRPDRRGGGAGRMIHGRISGSGGAGG